MSFKPYGWRAEVVVLSAQGLLVEAVPYREDGDGRARAAASGLCLCDVRCFVGRELGMDERRPAPSVGAVRWFSVSAVWLAVW